MLAPAFIDTLRVRVLSIVYIDGKVRVTDEPDGTGLVTTLLV